MLKSTRFVSTRNASFGLDSTRLGSARLNPFHFHLFVAFTSGRVVCDGVSLGRLAIMHVLTRIAVVQVTAVYATEWVS